MTLFEDGEMQTSFQSLYFLRVTDRCYLSKTDMVYLKELSNMLIFLFCILYLICPYVSMLPALFQYSPYLYPRPEVEGVYCFTILLSVCLSVTKFFCPIFSATNYRRYLKF